VACTFGQEPVEARVNLFNTEQHHYQNNIT
jgi:hypothetical protein